MSRQSHPHLLAQQLKNELKKVGFNLKEIILQLNIDYYKLDPQSLTSILHTIKAEITATPAYQQYQQKAHQRIRDQIDTLYTSDSRKHSYCVDVYREATAFPLHRDRQEGVFNLQPLYRRIVSKEVRRVIWSRAFNREALRKKFLLVDREVTPYKVGEELKMAISKLAASNDIILKENQKDVALRIMEYFVKVSSKVPHRYHNYIALNVVDLHSFYSPSKIVDLGAVALGLISLAESYKQADVQVRFEKIMKAITILDGESAEYIKQYYLQSGNGKREINECFEYFRLTLGASHLPLSTSQFLIDQLLIRKFCTFDIYVMFAIVVLIVSDEFDREEAKKPSFKEILDRAKGIVKLEDFVEAYSTIYRVIPAFHSPDDLQPNSNNELLLEMIACDGIKNAGDEDSNFVQNIEDPPRIGNKI